MLFLCVILGVLLASPALTSGLLADDVGQRAFILATLNGQTDAPWWDMFVLFGASPEQLVQLRYQGQVPWWTSTELHIAFWRPLTAATHYLDYMLWPEQAWLMHLHQLAWHGLACGLAWALYRRVSSSACAAGAAAIGLSLTHLHLSATAWLAHRNAVLVLVCALACLLAHDRWRRDGWWPGLVLGPLAYLAGLLCGEMGVAVLGFVLAYALTLDHATLARRAATLAPYLGVTVVWRFVYDALGYGVVGSGIYLDPVAAPGVWLAAAPGRMLELLIYGLGPPGEIGSAAIGRAAGALVVVAAIVAAGWPSQTEVRQRIAFAAIGLVLSLIPMTATAAHDRVLVVATIGSCMLFGEVLNAASDSDRQPGVGLRLGAVAMIAVHYVISPIASVVVAANVERFKVSSLPYPIASSLDDSKLRRQSLIVLHTPNLLAATLVPVSRQARGLNRPNFTWVLHAEPTAKLEVRLLDPHTLELHDPQGWLRGPDSLLVRGPAEPFAVGDQVQTLDYSLTVLEVVDGRPTRVSVEFHRPVNDPSFALVSWSGQDFELCPAAGELCP
ncbi:hypothetical protein ENSA7_67020 [Enhygromyxa salina]|uniref:Glycosyltransferase RgtA/B/C/D-like domain-containing protein n=1 Tax=Enhygromyxa salina TaxID=215803 RepID=A0A2S9XWX7_9BACT|nr:hypothetical protein ENSA7_67020 [Enhygromyxa salina]